MKKFNLNVLIIIGIGNMLFISGCSSEKIENSAIVSVVSEDISKIQTDSLPINAEDSGIISLPENTLSNLGFVDNENMIVCIKENKEASKSLCLYNVITKNSKEICKGNDIALSGNKENLLYTTIDEEHYLYDIKKNTHTKILTNFTEATFADYSGKYLSTIKFNGNYESAITILNSETNEIRSYNLGTTPWEISLFDGQTLSDNKYYFRGTLNNAKGIYSLDIENTNKIESVFSFPNGSNCLIFQFDFINNEKSIIFSGDYEKQPGVFIYDLENKEITKIASGLINQEKEYRGVGYSLSNDRTKILIESYVNDNLKSSIYLAAITGNSLSSKQCLYKESPQTFAAFSISSWWSSDDSFFLIDEKEYNPSQENLKYDTIRKFTITHN